MTYVCVGGTTKKGWLTGEVAHRSSPRPLGSRSHQHRCSAAIGAGTCSGCRTGSSQGGTKVTLLRSSWQLEKKAAIGRLLVDRQVGT